jgi:hypothetical protein
MSYRFWILLFFLPLSACTLFNNSPEKNREAICNELNHKIVFNAATGDQILATHERANMDSISKNYRAEGCDS